MEYSATVRANNEGKIGFVANKQCINVAIYRSRFGLIVFFKNLCISFPFTLYLFYSRILSDDETQALQFHAIVRPRFCLIVFGKGPVSLHYTGHVSTLSRDILWKAVLNASVSTTF